MLSLHGRVFLVLLVAAVDANSSSYSFKASSFCLTMPSSAKQIMNKRMKRKGRISFILLISIPENNISLEVPMQFFNTIFFFSKLGRHHRFKPKLSVNKDALSKGGSRSKENLIIWSNNEITFN